MIAIRIRCFITFLSIYVPVFVSAQTLKQKETNLKAFTELYGYVRFFHPSDEAAKINWFFYSLYGVHRVMLAKNDSQLLEELQELMLPIAPSVIIDSVPIQKYRILNKITPKNVVNYKLVNWVHKGLSLPNGSPMYKSRRNNRDTVDTSYVDYPLSTIELDATIGGSYEFTVEVTGEETDCYQNNLFVAAFDASDRLQNKSKTNKITGQTVLYKFQGNLPKGQNNVNFTLRVPKYRVIKINKPSIQVFDGGKKRTVEFKKPLMAKKASVDIILCIAEDEKFYATAAPSISDVTSVKLAKKIYAAIPNTLYSTNSVTYPQVDTASFLAFKNKLRNYWFQKPKDYSEETKLANLVITLSVLKFAFPYWDDTNTNPKKLFSFLFARAFEDKKSEDYVKSFSLMAAQLNDSHMGVSYSGLVSTAMKSVAIESEMINDKIYVKHVLDSSLKYIPLGSMIDSIDGESAQKKFYSKFRLMSGSPQWRSYKSLLGLFDGPSDSLKLVIKENSSHRVFKIPRQSPIEEYRPIALPKYLPKDGLISDNVYYYNLTGDTVMKKINTSLSSLENAKSIIFDMRGYPKDDVRGVFGHLLRCSEHTKWMHIPRVKEDNSKIEFESSGWNLAPIAPYFHGKIIFLSDACAVSQSESILGYVKGLKLGTIIGKPTAGTNGDVQTINLFDDLRFFFTGSKVTNADGSKSHYKGIIPDIKVISSVPGLKGGYDEVLEKALEFAKEN